MEPLTDKQREVLDYIEMRLAAEDPPTQREIAAHFGMHQNSVYQILRYLRQKGYLARDSRHRGVRLAERYRQHLRRRRGLPIVGRVAAGQPILAEENLEGRLDLEELLQAEEGTFLLRVTGDSMVDEGILDGDLVLVEPADEVPQGAIAVVMVESEVTVKRLFRRRGRVVLQPANRQAGYEPLVIDPKRRPVRVVGRVGACIRTSIR